MNIYVHSRQFAEFFLESKMFQTNIVGKIKTHFMFINLLPKTELFMRPCGKICYSQTCHRRHYNTAHGQSMLNT